MIHYINYVKLPKNIITDYWKLIDNNKFHKVILIFDIILKDEKYVIIKIKLENEIFPHVHIIIKNHIKYIFKLIEQIKDMNKFK